MGNGQRECAPAMGREKRENRKHKPHDSGTQRGPKDPLKQTCPENVPLEAAQCSGVAPALSRAPVCALNCSSSRVISAHISGFIAQTNRQTAKQINAQQKNYRDTETSIGTHRNITGNAPSLPLMAAQCSGVRCSASAPCTSTWHSSNARTAPA